MTPSERIKLALDLDLASEPIEGEVRAAGGSVHLFVGWLELTAALEQAIRRDALFFRACESRQGTAPPITIASTQGYSGLDGRKAERHAAEVRSDDQAAPPLRPANHLSNSGQDPRFPVAKPVPRSSGSVYTSRPSGPSRPIPARTRNQPASMNDEGPRRRLTATERKRVGATSGDLAYRDAGRSSGPPRAEGRGGRQDRHGR